MVGCVRVDDEAGAAGWHLDSTLRGELKDEVSQLDALATARDFPRLLEAHSSFPANVGRLAPSRIRPETVDLLALDADLVAETIGKAIPPGS